MVRLNTCGVGGGRGQHGEGSGERVCPLNAVSYFGRRALQSNARARVRGVGAGGGGGWGGDASEAAQAGPVSSIFTYLEAEVDRWRGGRVRQRMAPERRA